MQDKKIRVKSDIIAREARRKQVASLLQQSVSETAIAQQLGVDLSTVSRDVSYLKQIANQFVYDLARENVAYFYKSTIDDINKARVKAWSICNNCKDQQRQLNALKIVISSNESMFNLLQQGPAIMSLRAMEERLANIERGQTQDNNNNSNHEKVQQQIE